ncbi:hypothetical protein SESBI_20486 [Sesbania bispinosa]|nr:hypothetical protein SESBI_20486 [Sesbania bispinosa]
MLEDFSGHVLVRDVTDIKTPMELIFEELCKIGAIEKKRDSRKGAMCAIHPDAEHSIENGELTWSKSQKTPKPKFPKVPTPLTLHGTQTCKHRPAVDQDQSLSKSRHHFRTKLEGGPLEVRCASGVGMFRETK